MADGPMSKYWSQLGSMPMNGDPGTFAGLGGPRQPDPVMDARIAQARAMGRRGMAAQAKMQQLAGRKGARSTAPAVAPAPQNAEAIGRLRGMMAGRTGPAQPNSEMQARWQQMRTNPVRTGPMAAAFDKAKGGGGA